jgi:hypothetical protein
MPLRIAPHMGELWDGPASTAVAVFEFAQPALGENRKVTVGM